MAKLDTNMGDPHGDPQTSPQHADPHGFLVWFSLKGTKSMWIGVLWAGLRAAMWITHVGGKFRHGLLEKSLIGQSDPCMDKKTGNSTKNRKRGCATKVPEGHHPRGTTLREALRGNLPLRGFSRASAGVLFEGSAGLCGALRGSPAYPILVTLENCWKEGGCAFTPVPLTAVIVL